MKRKDIEKYLNLDSLERLFREHDSFTIILNSDNDDNLEDQIENLSNKYIKDNELLNIEELNKEYNSLIRKVINKNLEIYSKQILEYQKDSKTNTQTYEEIYNEEKDNFFIKEILSGKDIFEIDIEWINKYKKENNYKNTKEVIDSIMFFQFLFIIKREFIENEVKEEFELNENSITLAEIILNRFNGDEFYKELMNNKALPKEIRLAAHLSFTLIDFFDNVMFGVIGHGSVFFEVLREMLDEEYGLTYDSRSIKEKRLEPNIFTIGIDLTQDDLFDEEKELKEKILQIYSEYKID